MGFNSLARHCLLDLSKKSSPFMLGEDEGSSPSEATKNTIGLMVKWLIISDCLSEVRGSSPRRVVSNLLYGEGPVGRGRSLENCWVLKPRGFESLLLRLLSFTIMTNGL